MTTTRWFNCARDLRSSTQSMLASRAVLALLVRPAASVRFLSASGRVIRPRMATAAAGAATAVEINNDGKKFFITLPDGSEALLEYECVAAARWHLD